MSVRYVECGDWFNEEYDECLNCGCYKGYSTDWYCDKCNDEIEKESRE